MSWKGYNDMTWEPEANLTNCPKIVHDYWERVRREKCETQWTTAEVEAREHLQVDWGGVL